MQTGSKRDSNGNDIKETLEQQGAVYQVTTSFLAFRPGETFVLQNSVPTNIGLGKVAVAWQRLYKVALIPTPPIDGGDVHEVHRNQAVICAEFYRISEPQINDAWGWVSLEESTKRAIGYELEAVGAVENEWFWMILDTRVNRYGNTNGDR